MEGCDHNGEAEGSGRVAADFTDWTVIVTAAVHRGFRNFISTAELYVRCVLPGPLVLGGALLGLR
ncbi:hypothetical protein F2Q68_00019967 [Brassica cretica]|uniref:Uncharacterized protein n=1 Tax=Brassica cretica TaxID=69181 RepID=A0A8S9FYN9_BRACR|nr:hypothetical protein F2Q68_00019967 [Brassica cretica]